jgi:hypothetical protein
VTATLSISQEVQQAIATVERGASPGVRAGFARRAAAIELLEVHVLDRLRYLEEGAGLPADLQGLAARASALRQRLEATNERVLRRLRGRISSGRYTPEGLRRAFARYAGPPGGTGGYDALDLLVGGLLDVGTLPEESAVREPEMVAYQPTPARAILELLEQANLGPDDILFDLGSGLGRVVILVALLSGAQARGVEFEPVYCEYAGRCARSLNLPGVEFLQADAREARLADGTVFFMFTPFRGALLRQVLDRLRAQARERPIRVCTYGPCTAEVAGASWLRPGGGRVPGEHDMAVFQSV